MLIYFLFGMKGHLKGGRPAMPILVHTAMRETISLSSISSTIFKKTVEDSHRLQSAGHTEYGTVFPAFQNFAKRT